MKSIRKLLLVAAGCVVAGVSLPHGETGHQHGPGFNAATTSQTVTGPRFTRLQLTNEYWSEGAALADLDRDGDFDIVSGAFWYEGPGFEKRHAYAPATASFELHEPDGSVRRIPGFEGALGVKNSYTDNFVAFAHDFNGDGWLDILTLPFMDKEAFWYENPRGGDQLWQRHLALANVGGEAPTFKDITGHGKPELICVQAGEYGYAMPGEDPTRPWQFHAVSTGAKASIWAHGLGVGDVNGDGRADLLTNQGWWEQPPTLGAGARWTNHRADFGQSKGGAQMHVYDVNGDGLSDVISSTDAHGYGLAWFEQRRSGDRISFQRHWILEPTARKNAQGLQFSQLHAVAVEDVDGDGLKDIVTGKRFWAHGKDGDVDAGSPPVLYWFKLVREGKAVQFQPHLVDADSGIGTDLVLADVNGDARPDIITANKKGVFVHQQQFGGFSPRDAARAMSLPPDFEAIAFAGEPDIRQPIAFAIDDRGRLWVVEAYTYPVRRPEGEGTDRVLVFEDTDGDGRFDRRTVFMSNLNLVSGIEVGFGGVWIGAAPYLLFVPLADGDHPKPAGPPRVVLDGWGHEDTHETLNTFQWGPDGWLYGSHGVFTHSAVGKPGTPAGQRQKINAGIWRYHPVKQRFEVFAHGTSNPWGMDFDSRGQLIAEACVIPHLWHFTLEGRYQKQNASPGNPAHYNPYTYDDIKTAADHMHYAGTNPHGGNGVSDAQGGGHAHAGLMIYQGGSWPDEYRGRAYMNNIHGARINVDRLERSGSGFRGRHHPDFIRFNDPWSQVVNLQYDQDGSVYLIDWYDQEQCHINNPDVPDRGNGRIFKVVYGKTPTTRIDMQRRGDPELLADLSDRREWRSRHARRVLQERAAAGTLTPQVVAYLRGGLGLGGTKPAAQPGTHHALDSDEAQLRLLWTLHSVGALSEDDALRLTARPEEYLRAWAVQLASEDRAPSDDALRAFAKLAREDSSPVVRLALASTALRIEPGRRWELTAALHARSEDELDANLPMLNWYALEPLATLEPGRALGIALQSRMPRSLEYTARRLASLKDDSALALLTESLRVVDDDPRRHAVLAGMHAGLQGRRDVAMPAGWLDIERTLSQSTAAGVRSELLAVSLIFATPSSLATARATLANRKADLESRRSALQALLNVRDPQVQPLLVNVLKEPELRGAAIRGLATFSDPNTPRHLVAIYPSLPAKEKRDTLSTLAARPPFARALVDAFAAGQVPVQDLPADIASQIRNLGDAGITASLEKLWGVARTSGTDKAGEIARYRAIIHAAAPWPDGSRGRVVFQQTCGACHRLFNEGGTLGPEITGSNRGDLDYLLHNIVDPNAEIPNTYRMAAVTLKDGRVLSGFANVQDPQVVTVTTPNDVVRVPREEISSLLQSDVSMMPEGLLRPLSDDDVRALVLYLRSEWQYPMPGEAWGGESTKMSLTLFDGKSLEGWEGDPKWWWVEAGAITGGSRSEEVAANQFIATKESFGNFELRLQIRITGSAGVPNSGVQIRSERHHGTEMIGYQVDAGDGWWGKLYDESRRDKVIAEAADMKAVEAAIRRDDWNEYRIRAEGRRIRSWINGVPALDYREEDASIPQRGKIGIQVHSGGKTLVQVREVSLLPLPE